MQPPNPQRPKKKPGPADDTGPGRIWSSTMPKDLINSNRPAQPHCVVKVEWRHDDPRALRLQWERDEDWFDEKPDRGILLRPMIEPERAEFQLRVPPGHKGVVIIAMCGDCHCRYIKPAVVPAADVAVLSYVSPDELLTWL